MTCVRGGGRRLKVKEDCCCVDVNREGKRMVELDWLRVKGK
jgi:hypothetical protein